MTNGQTWWLTIVTAVVVASVIATTYSIRKLKKDNNLK